MRLQPITKLIVRFMTTSDAFAKREAQSPPALVNSSQIHQQPARVFERFFHAHQEGHGAFAVDDAVVVAESARYIIGRMT